MEIGTINHTAVVHFLTVVKHMNMNRAAEELYISQPALSASIARLESQLGLKLFNRENKRLKLSRNGKELLDAFVRLRNAHDDIFTKAEQLKKQDRNIVNVAFCGSSYAFSTLITSGVLEKAEHSILKFCYVDSDTARQMLHSGEIDLIISSLPIQDSKFVSKAILTEDIGICVNKQHPLASCSSISLAEINGVDCHGLSKNNQFRILCDRLLSQFMVHINYVSEEGPYNYYQRILSSQDYCIFFASKQTYQSTFHSTLRYTYLPIDEPGFCKKTMIHYLQNRPVNFDPDEISGIIRENHKNRDRPLLVVE